MTAPRFRSYAAPLSIALISAIIGRRIAVHLQDEWGVWATIVGTAILVGGLIAAITIWWRGRG